VVGLVFLLGELAGLQCDRVGGERAGIQRGCDAGDDLFVGQAAVQEQYFDERAGGRLCRRGSCKLRPTRRRGSG
jgi:hypothetical protein